MGIRRLKPDGWINGTKLRTLKLIPHPSKSSRPAMEIDIKATRPAFFSLRPKVLGAVAERSTSEATPGKLVLFLTERFKCSLLKGFKWDGNLMKFDEMGGIWSWRFWREKLEVHKNITFNIRVPLKRHSNIASAFRHIPMFCGFGQVQPHMCREDHHLADMVAWIELQCVSVWFELFQTWSKQNQSDAFIVFSSPISCERLNVPNCQPRRGKVREPFSKLLVGRVGAIENAIAPFTLNVKVCWVLLSEEHATLDHVLHFHIFHTIYCTMSVLCTQYIYYCSFCMSACIHWGWVWGLPLAAVASHASGCLGKSQSITCKALVAICQRFPQWSVFCGTRAQASKILKFEWCWSCIHNSAKAKEGFKWHKSVASIDPSGARYTWMVLNGTKVLAPLAEPGVTPPQALTTYHGKLGEKRRESFE